MDDQQEDKDSPTTEELPYRPLVVIRHYGSRTHAFFPKPIDKAAEE